MSDTWTLVEPAFDVQRNLSYEAWLAIGSGVLHQRAAFEEGLGDEPQDIDYLPLPGGSAVRTGPVFKSRVGTYLPAVTGLHPTCGEQMINLPALHGLILFCGGERLDMQRSRVTAYRRWLDLRVGRLHRAFTWHTATGAELHVALERFISARRPHVQALRCRVAHVGGPPAELRLIGALDAEVRTNGHDHFATVETTGEHEPITLLVRTDSGIDVAAAALLACNRSIAWGVDEHPRWVGLSGSYTLDSGQTLDVRKIAALTSSRHVRGAALDAARRLAWEAATAGYERLVAESNAVWAQRWARTDVEIEGDPVGQRALRVGLYHLLRTASEDDARVGLDALAASSAAGGGRVHSDCDLFALPVLLYTLPAVGKVFARHRLASLTGARRNARRLGYPGAVFAWEPGPTGDAQPADRTLAEHAVHVTAAVAYGLWQTHMTQAEDVPLLRDVTEVLIETARFWRERVTVAPEGQTFEILMAIGPDTFSPPARNNAYTNRMAALNLRLAVFAYEKLTRQDAALAAALADGLKLEEGELARFADIAARLRMPYAPEAGLVLHADDFFTRAPFDFERWWSDRARPLGAQVSRERLRRSRVLSRPDVVQLMLLLPQEFDAAQMRTAVATYGPLTVYDVPVGRAVQATVAAWAGRADEAAALWRASAELGPGTDDGVSLAWAGANWHAVLCGFAGLRTRMQSECLHLDPHLPAGWTALRFPLVWEGQPVRICVEPGRVTIEHQGNRPLPVRIGTQTDTLPPAQTRTFVL